MENSTLFSLPCLSSPFFFLISVARVGDKPPLLTQIGVLGDTVIFLEKACYELSGVKLLCQAEQTEEESAPLPSSCAAGGYSHTWLCGGNETNCKKLLMMRFMNLY